MQLLLGLDNVAYMPREMEMGRYADEGGQLIIFQSFISGAVLPSGSRCTGYESTMKYEGGQQSYRIIEDGSEVSLIRSETKTQDSCHLFKDNRAGLSRTEKKFFNQFKD